MISYKIIFMLQFNEKNEYNLEQSILRVKRSSGVIKVLNSRLVSPRNSAMHVQIVSFTIVMK